MIPPGRTRTSVSISRFNAVFRGDTRLTCGRLARQKPVVRTFRLRTLCGSPTTVDTLISRTFHLRFFRVRGNRPLPFGNARVVMRGTVSHCLRRLLRVSDHQTPFGCVNDRIPIHRPVAVRDRNARLAVLLKNAMSHVSDGRNVAHVVSCGANNGRGAVSGMRDLFDERSSHSNCMFRTFCCTRLLRRRCSRVTPSLLFMHGIADGSFRPGVVVGNTPIASFGTCDRTCDALLARAVSRVFGDSAPCATARGGRSYGCYGLLSLYEHAMRDCVWAGGAPTDHIVKVYFS